MDKKEKELGAEQIESKIFWDGAERGKNSYTEEERVEDTPDLSYEHQFVYFEIGGEEQGFYSKALEIVK